MAADSLVSKAFGGLLGGGGGGGGLFGGLFGGGAAAGGGAQLIGDTMWLADGGHVTGPGNGTSDEIPAMLSNGEYVVTAAATAKHRRLLDAINSGSVSRFASGGLVGASPISSPSLPSAAGSSAGSQSVTQNVSVVVNSNGGTKDQNDDLAAKVGQKVQDSLKAMVADQMRKAVRPGGMMNYR